MNSISTARAVCISLGTLEKSFDSMKTYKENLVIYLNMINVLRSKFNFGIDQVKLFVNLVLY